MSTHTTTALPGVAAPAADRYCRHDLLWGTCWWCPAVDTRTTFSVAGPTLHATVVVPAWYATLCRNPGCGHRSDVGDPVGLVPGVGPCCASCIGLDPDGSERPEDRRGWVA
jgi:hypothetical protein